MEPATSAKGKKLVAYVAKILENERDIVITSPPLEAAQVEVDGIAGRTCSTRADSRSTCCTRSTTRRSGRSASSSPRGWTNPRSLAKFKFARQKSALAGTIRGSYFVIKGEY